MRISIIVDCYYPHSTASAKLVHDLGIELHKQGHSVTVITPNCLNDNDLELCIESELTVARIKTGKLKGVSRLSRAVREARLSATMWRKGKEFFRNHPCDLILFYSPSIFFGELVRKLKSLWKCPSYLILRDIFPQWAVDAGVMKKGWAYKYFRMKELEQYAAADIIGVQSQANLDYFATSLPNKRYDLEVIHNWTTLDDQEFVPGNYREKLGLQEKVVFFYGGNIGVAQDIDNIVRLADRLLAETEIQFLLVGDGSEVERLKALIVEKELVNIRILPPVSQQEYLAMLSEFDIGLISLDKRLQTQNFPGKLLGYMYFSMPMLCSLNPGNDLKTMLERSEAGLCSLNGEDEVFLANALSLAKDAALRQKTGQNARQLLERDFAVSVVARRILSHFKASPRLHYAGAEKPMAPATATL